MRQVDVDEDGAAATERIERGLEGARHFGVHAVIEHPRGNADPCAPELARERGDVIADRFGCARGIGRVGARENTQRQRGVVDRSGERPDLIQRRREGEEAVT